MDCSSCGHPNPVAARFCGSCAVPLAGSSRCPSCGASNPPGQRFCNACAQALAEGEAAPVIGEAAAAPDPRTRPPEHLAEKIRAGRATLEGERKQVTVLFADVMGSMELAEQSDPEQWRRIMDRFFSILCAGVHRFEGTVDKFTGDGIMALFGAPIAHEDHARRACYAALHLQRELAAYAAELRRAHGLGFSERMGLNSGEVVVGAIGEDLAMEYTAVGHTVGLAQRMEQIAAADRVYLSEHAASLVEGYLALGDLGEFQVKGVGRPLAGDPAQCLRGRQGMGDGDVREFARLARQALEIAERIGDSFSRTHAWLFLGLAERMRGQWRQAIEALEHSRAIARTGRTGTEADPLRLVLLGESYLGLGDPERARTLAAEGLEIAHARGGRSRETYASLALARVLLGSAGAATRAEIEAALARALELARETGAKAFEPLIHVELAELARRSGEEEERERELREAHRLFTEIGASGHAERLAALLTCGGDAVASGPGWVPPR
jgi:class 3 adenylate cyclase